MNNNMLNAFAVFLGGGAGCLLRFTAGKLLPFPTFAVNIAGCFLIGLVAELSRNSCCGERMQLLLATGFCGGLTTFSTFSRELLQSLQEGRLRFAILYASASVVLGIVSAFLGSQLAGRV